MARPKIENIRSLGDFATLFRWNLKVSTPPAVAPEFNTNTTNLRCESTNIPMLSGQSMELNIRGHTVKQPGIYRYNGQITLTFVETVDAKIHKALRAWREACWQAKTGVTQLKSDLEAVLVLEQLNNQDEVIWSYVLYGCFYEDGDFGQLDGTSGDAQRVTLTCSYDYFEDNPA